MSLINLFYKLKNNNKGSVIVFTALAMTVIVGFTALVTDVGLLYFNRVRLSNAADAAALAGAQSLALSKPEEAEYSAKYYAQKGIDIPEENVDIDVDPENKLVTVTLNKEVFLCFARVLNISSSNVAATARATYEYPTKVTNISKGNVFPLFITELIYEKVINEDGSIDENATIELMGDSPGNKDEEDGFVKITKENGEEESFPGNWGALHFGDDNFTPALEGTLNKAVDLEEGEWHEDGTKTGTMGGEVRDAVDHRLENIDVLTYGLIPIVDIAEDKGGGKIEVRIKSFAVLEVQGTEKDSPGWTIIANLVDGKCIADFMGETTSDDDHDYGARVLRLID